MFDAIEEGQEASVQYFNNWTEKVKKAVPEERLIVFNVKEGWEPLCSFLNLPVPDMPFPRGNDTAAMKWRFKERKIRAYLFVIFVPLLLSLIFYYIFHEYIFHL